MNLKPRILNPPLTAAQIKAMTGVEPLIVDPTKPSPEVERRLEAIFAGLPDPVDLEALRAKMGPADQAYFAWVKRVLKTDEHLPLAKVAWDAGIEYRDQRVNELVQAIEAELEWMDAYRAALYQGAEPGDGLRQVLFYRAQELRRKLAIFS